MWIFTEVHGDCVCSALSKQGLLLLFLSMDSDAFIYSKPENTAI